MAKYSELYRSIVMSPIAVTDKDGVILDTKKVLGELKWEVKLISDLAYYEMTAENLERLQDFLKNVSSTYRNKDIGRKLGFVIPEKSTCQIREPDVPDCTTCSGLK